MADLPFVIEPPGDLALATAAARAAARTWRLPEPELMRVGMNALFAAGDDVVLRIGRPTVDPDAAIWLSHRLAQHGLAVPRFVRDRAFVSEPLAVHAIARVDTTGPTDWAAVGSMVARLHELEPADVSAHYPTPWCSSFPWWQFDRLLADVGDLVDPAARRGIDHTLARHREWRRSVDQVVLCHGDVHPGNVLQTDRGPVLIDWDLLCVGPRGWDHAPTMTWTERWGGEPGIYEAFADGYGTSLRGDPVAEALAELRLLAATLMRLRAGRTDAAAAAEAERRLQWWRGGPGAPRWSAM